MILKKGRKITLKINSMKRIMLHYYSAVAAKVQGWWGEKDGKLGIFYDVQIFRIYLKNTSCTRSETFHKVWLQDEWVYNDSSTHAHGLSLSDWKSKFVLFSAL